MERVLKIPILAAVILCLLAGTVLAIPLSSEYDLINVDTYSADTPNYTPGTDLGYYIWTDDAERTSWHIRWSGDGPNTYFSGLIVLDNNEFDEITEFKFDNHNTAYDPDPDWSVNGDDWVTYFALANVGEDGLDFTINNLASPSFIGFDLFMNFSNDIGDNIFIGADMVSLSSLGSDGDFKMAAPLPVPEPASIFLMGLGVAGFAAVRRRRRTMVA